MLLGSPLLPTDHRDSPRTLTTRCSRVNTLNTRCREAHRTTGKANTPSGASEFQSPYMMGPNVIASNISLAAWGKWGVLSRIGAFSRRRVSAAPLEQPQALGAVLGPREDDDAGRDQDRAHPQEDGDRAELGLHARAVEQAVPDAREGVCQR